MPAGDDPLAPSRFHPIRHLVMGIRNAGDTAYATQEAPHELEDFAIGWGMRNQSLGLSWARRFVCLEMAFLGNRFENNFLGFDALNGLGRWPLIDGREEAWMHLLKPYRVPAKVRRVLVFGQLPRDLSLVGLDNGKGEHYRSWVVRLINTLKARGYEVRFRQHPVATAKEQCEVRAPAADGPLAEELEWAGLCAAYSSNALVDAFLAGCPVMPFSETSMTWRFRSSLAEVRPVSHDQRVEWLRWVASSQWSQEQIMSGEAWRTLMTMEG